MTAEVQTITLVWSVALSKQCRRDLTVPAILNPGRREGTTMSEHNFQNFATFPRVWDRFLGKNYPVLTNVGTRTQIEIITIIIVHLLGLAPDGRLASPDNRA
jgi:hypothetical protein